MRNDWEPHLVRWVGAGVVDGETAARVRAWERENAPAQGLRWPILMALAFGAILLGAGVLLFVSAHWDDLSTAPRMGLVVLMVAAFHAGGIATATRFEGLSIALHTLGTVSLGAAIALAGQIFNLSEHWPSAILLWAVGAAIAWALLGHWTQAALTAMLVPAWLCGEWSARMADAGTWFALPASAGICALSFSYLSARRGPSDSVLRKTLGWLGGLALLPAAIAVAIETWTKVPPWNVQWVAWSLAILGPLGVAAALRGRQAVWNAIPTVWTLLLAASNDGHGGRLPVYLCCAIGSVGLAAWGIRESRPERINLGVAGFALTVLFFYFSDVMDKLGRSASLMLMGLLFLGGGWLLEKTRRRLIARIRPEGA